MNRMNEQLSFLSFIPWNTSLKGKEKEWLEANGYKNIYDKTPDPGLYEWTNIEYPDKTKLFAISERGIHIGNENFNPVWWREISFERKEAYLEKIKPKDVPLGSGGYTVWRIEYEWMPNRWFGVWNKRGNSLEFYDKEHAEYFIEMHPESIYGHPYRIVPRTYSPDMADEMEYGNRFNVWENEP